MSDAEIGGASSPAEGTPPDEAKQPMGPGAQLKAFREERGLTIEQVASQLNLASRQIQALENDNYAALPGLVIAKGFVRAYAKLLKVDAAPLVALVAQESGAHMDSLEMQRAFAESLSGSMLPEMKRKSPTSGWRNGVLLAIVVLLGAFVVYQMGEGSFLSSAPSTKTEIKSQPAAVQTPVPVPQANNEPSVSSNLPSSLNATAVASVPPASNVSEGHRASESNQVKSAASVPVQPLATPPASTIGTAANVKIASPAAAGTNTSPAQTMANAAALPLAAPTPTQSNIVLKINQDSWIEIRRSDKTVLISRLVKAGSTEAFDLTKPATLVVGNAAGVDVVVRGKPLELKPIAKTNVARVELK
ncbi:MAG: helix-turn-helix domain-containing protein [Burkholderiales bacterium]|nr:helix-turn-helix domain-containing protein [Burkholderiales bacterium]